MSTPTCPKCEQDGIFRPKTRRHGSYFRTSDKKWVERFQCPRCRKGFSEAIFDTSYRRKERLKGKTVADLLCSGVSQRRCAFLLKINRKTAIRSFRNEAAIAECNLRNGNLQKKFSAIEFDDLETFEHSKYKPLSVTLAVEEKSRRILGLEVSVMPSNGPLAKKSLEKYGFRRDGRKEARDKLFSELKPMAAEDVVFKSDENPHYPKSLKKFFPQAPHLRFKGGRGAITGQGELKKLGFDPLFSLNHTCAMLRANINRLFRRTWCTTKLRDRLRAHLFLYAEFHNSRLIESP